MVSRVFKYLNIQISSSNIYIKYSNIYIMLYDCFRNFCFNFLPHLLTTLANDKFGPVQVNNEYIRDN